MAAGETIPMTKVEKFRDMWNSTHFVYIAGVSFEYAWLETDENMVRPKHIEELKIRFSFSENTLYNFFLCVYGGNTPNMLNALLYWKPSTVEGKIILDWIENQFWF
jgi:hypothetical protein